MKTNYTYFVGVDVNKEHLDFAIYHRGKVDYHKRVSNQIEDIENYLEEELGQEMYHLLEEHTLSILEHLKKQIKSIEQQMKAIIEQDQYLKTIYELTTSVRGVGIVTGIAIILATGLFEKISCPKKFACYAGVAPLENSAGKSKEKVKTSHIANKKLKALLQNCVTSSLRYPSEFRVYFDRKKAEGKKTRVVMNALRNKIIQRIFVCVKSGVKYQENYQNKLLLS